MVLPGKGGSRAPLFLTLPAAWLILLTIMAIPALADSPLSGYNPARLATERNGAFFNGRAFFANTTLPDLSYLDDSWDGRFTPVDHGRGDLYWDAAAGVVVKGVRVAAINRGELFLSMNRDTQEFFYRTKKHLDLTPGRNYLIDMNGNGFVANGAEVSYGKGLDSLLPGLSAGLTLRYLAPTTLQNGTVTGIVQPTGPRSYDFNLYLDYVYGHNVIYKREDENLGGGYGYSGDIGVRYRRGGFTAEAAVRDLGGTIVWYSAPYTTATANSATMTVFPDGYQRFAPSLSGYEAQKRFRQHIPLKTDVSAAYQQGQWDGSFTINLIEDTPHYFLETGFRPCSAVRVSLGYNIEYSAASLGVSAAGFDLSMMTDDIELREAKALGLILRYQYNW